MISMLKKIFVICLLLIGVSCFAEPLKAGISKIDSVPNSFYGSWRVVAKLDKQSGATYFKPQAVDFWNLSRTGDVINLNNPFTGASAFVKLDYIDGNLIRFTKTGDYDGNKNANKTTLCLKLGSKQKALNLLLIFYAFSYILLIPFAIKTNNYLYFITYITIPLVFDLYRMLKMYNQDRTSIPTIRFWHNPLENWDKIKNTYNAPFYLRFFFARNISTYFMLLTCIAIIFD